jgi:hypothetical protein
MSSNIHETTCPPPAGVGIGAEPIPPLGATGPTVVPPPPHSFEEERDEADDCPNPAAAAFHRIKCDIDELKEYASYYLAAKVDGVRRTVRNIGLYAALGVLGLLAGGAIVATAAGLIIVGIAQGLGRLFGGMYWLGDLVTGIIVLAVIGGAAWFMMNKLTGSWRSQTIKKYEQRKQTQRVRFGHNVNDRAGEGASASRAAGSQKRA